MRKRKIIIPAILLAWSALLLTMSWKVAGFSDFYVKYIFPIWGNTYGRVFSFLPFSVGELLIYGSILYVILYLIMCLLRLFFFIGKSGRLKRVVRINGYIIFCMVVFIVVVQIQNCFVLYHTTPIYGGTETEAYKSNPEDLVALRERLVVRANELAETFERDEKGNIVYVGDIEALAKEAMTKLSREGTKDSGLANAGDLGYKLSLLGGFYSTPKPLLKSDFFSQQGIMGYYFPFSLEANYNDIMYIANLPDTLCHELSHLKGFIYEDEASFLAYLACIGSGNEFFEYSGIQNALGYVYSESEKAIRQNPKLGEGLTGVSEKVAYDSVFLTEETWAEVEADAWFSTETLDKASEEFIDTNLTLNGVESGIMSYSEVVNLLLKYYYGTQK